jgi:TolB-like protein/thioredoxin-like negative regulator of GroEL/predicted Ser/Thr protein kinase
MATICPKCQSENPEAATFCADCGTRLSLHEGVSVSITKTMVSSALEGTTLAGKYRIIEPIGRGGMGVVYKAEDIKLERFVALKFLPAELIAVPEARERFVREAKAAAALSHPHICTVHEINEEEKEPFIVMEYVEGQSLKEKIRKGALDQAEALDIAIQVAEGLDEAHKKGIVHRDIKPGNIMVADTGMAKVMDFGLAKVFGASLITQEAKTMGTVAYMSPEQAKGVPVDQRTDVWSLGVVLYEMITGQLPFKGEHEQSLIHSILNTDPIPPGKIRKDLQKGLESIVLKALAKNPNSRYQGMGEALEDLKAVAGGLKPMRAKTGLFRGKVFGIRKIYASAGLAFVIVLAGWLLFFSPKNGTAIDSIAVLPFDNATPDDYSLDYLCDGISDTIRPKLSGWPALRNIARESARSYKGRTADPAKIGRELKVQAILTGTVRRMGERLSVRPALVRTWDASLIREWQYEGTPGGKPEDLIALLEDNEFAAALLRELGRKLSPEEEKRAAAKPIQNAAAYEYYLRARQENDAFTFESISRAQEYLAKALELEGDNALLAFGMAESYLNLSWLDIRKSGAILAKAEEYLARALTRDPALPEAHALSGIIESHLKGNQREAIRHFKIALAANPEEPTALCYLAKTYLLFMGRISAAVPLYEKLKEVDPQNWGNKTIPGDMEFYSGRYDKAVDSWGPVFRANPEDAVLSYAYSLALIYAGRQEEAFPLIDKNANSPTPNYYLTVVIVLLKAALQQDRQKVASLMTPDFQSVCRRDCGISHIAAAAMAQLGEKKLALDLLQNAVDRGFWNYPFLEKDPLLKSLRGETRFKAILEQARKEWEGIED